MGILDNVERGLERAVNGAFAKTFRSRLQPLEIFAALKTELDANTRILSRQTIVVPNEFTVHISREDFDRLKTDGAHLADQFVADLHTYADQQGYQFTGPVVVAITPDPALSVGLLNVTSVAPGTQIDLVPALEVQGQTLRLREGVNVIGRSHDSDIVVADSAASKRNASITWDGTTAVLRDLGSTNGTKIDGQRITALELASPTTFTVGSTPLTYRMAPKATAR